MKIFISGIVLIMLMVSSFAFSAQVFQGSVTGNSQNVNGTVAIGNGGTGAVTAPLALTALGASPVAGPGTSQAFSVGALTVGGLLSGKNLTLANGADASLTVNDAYSLILGGGTTSGTAGKGVILQAYSGGGTQQWVNALSILNNGGGLITSAFTGNVSLSGQLSSTLATGTAPFSVVSTTPVTNLSIGGNAATVTNATLTTALTNNGGAGTLTWPAAGATLTIPTGGGTLGTGAFATAYTLPTATNSVLGGVKPDGTTITNSSGAISVTYGTTSTSATVGNDARLGAGAVTGAIKSNGNNSFSQASYADLSSGAPTATASVLGLVKPDGTSILNTAGAISATAASVGALAAATTQGTMSCISMGGSNRCQYAASVANNGTVTLPTITSGYSGQGEITIGADTDHAQFTTDASGNVNLIWTSAGIVANAATASKFQLGAATPANPVVLTNATGGAVTVVLSFIYH